MDHKENEEIVCNKCKNHLRPKKEKNYKQSLPCSNCNEVFKNKPALKKHIKDCMLGFYCPICEDKINVCNDLYTLKSHFVSHNSPDILIGAIEGYLRQRDF